MVEPGFLNNWYMRFSIDGTSWLGRFSAERCRRRFHAMPSTGITRHALLTEGAAILKFGSLEYDYLLMRSSYR